MHAFRATLYRVGVNRCVDVPPRVSQALGGGARIGVVGTANGIAFRSTLVPRGGGRHRLFIHGRVWRTLGLEDGARVHVQLALDPAADVVEMPPYLREALERRPAAAAVFARMPPASRREIVRSLEGVRTAATRERRLERGLDRLEAWGAGARRRE